MEQNTVKILSDFLHPFLPAVIFLVTVICGYIIRKMIFSRLNRWAKTTATQLDDIIISSLKKPVIIWFVMLGAYFALEYATLSDDLTRIIQKILVVLGILSVTLALASMTTKLIRSYSSRLKTSLPVTSLTQNFSRVVIFAVGIMVILNSLGISIAPILATLGVGGLAVALALQDTLANFFAGIHILIARQIQVGDYIKLETGQEGYVTDINWRSTKIRMLPNNVVIIPNDRLLKAIVINHYLPDKEMAVLIDVGVHYSSDLAKVEKLTCEVAKQVMREVQGGVAEFDPFIRYHTFGESSINFSVIMRAKEYVDQYLIKHEFVKRLQQRYHKEGIVIPYPIRAVNFSQERSS